MSFVKKNLLLFFTMLFLTSTLLGMRTRKLKAKKLREHVTKSIQLIQDETEAKNVEAIFNQAKKKLVS